MSDQLGGVGGKQRIGFAGADHDTARAELAGEPHGFGQQVERIGAHLCCCAGDVDVDVGHVERGELQAALVHHAADRAALLGRQVRRPQMARVHHQLEFLESEVREPRQAGLGAVRPHIRIGVAPKHRRVGV
jgi:hypothetical protein